MALGGGIFVNQNKILPGCYINFVSASRGSSALSQRGYAAMPLEMDWGEDGRVFAVDAADIQNNSLESLKLFGYNYEHDKLKGLRDLFLNKGIAESKIVLIYKGLRGTRGRCDRTFDRTLMRSFGRGISRTL